MSSTSSGVKNPSGLQARHWKMAVAAGMASFLDSAIIVSLAINLALFKDEFAMSTWAVGALSAALTLSIAAGAFFGGRIADIFGRQRVFSIDILVYALGVGIIALAPNSTVLFVGFIIGGIAAGADLPTSLAVVSERSPAGAHGRLLSFTQVMWIVGIAFSKSLGFALSGTGVTGARLTFGLLAVVAVVTWLVRSFNKDIRSLEETGVQTDPAAPANVAMPLLQILATRAFLVSAVLTLCFYVFWGLIANTFGQFQPYFLITVGGASQTLATGLGLALLPIGLVMSVFFLKVVDTRWRTTAFLVGAVIQIGSMVVAGIADGVILIYVVALGLFSIGGNLAGEANYKVWTQESLPVNARATVQGFTYSMARFIFAAVALVTPTWLEKDPNSLLWSLVGCAALALVFGRLTIRSLAARGIHPGGRQAAEVPLPNAEQPAPEVSDRR